MDNELMHYGILGMKWGRRKAINTSDDYKKSRSIKKKHVSEMSNQELKQLNERLQLEANYKQLTSRKKKEGYGKKFLNQLEQKIINTAVDATWKKSAELKDAFMQQPEIQKVVNIGKQKTSEYLNIILNKVKK